MLDLSRSETSADIELLMDDGTWKPGKLLHRGTADSEGVGGIGWAYVQGVIKFWAAPDEWRFRL